MDYNEMYMDLRSQLEKQMKEQDPLEHKRVTEVLLKFPSQNAWIMYPILPLIRKIEMEKPLSFNNVIRGFVFADDIKKVFIGNCFEQEPKKVAEYESIDTVLEDGWVVDFSDLLA